MLRKCPIPTVVLLLSIMLVFSCSYQEFMEAVNVQKPKVSLKQVKLTDLSFDAADLTFDFTVRNPNLIGINLTAFDYDLEINDHSFISGKQDKGMTIPAQGNNSVQFPLTLKYKDIYQAVTSLKDKDSTDFKIACSFSFELPVLGTIRVPVSHTGRFPVIRIPSVSLNGIKLDRIDITGADLTIQLKLKNTNSFNLNLNKMDFRFDVNGNQWMKSSQTKQVTVKKKQTHSLEIPVSLNFLQMGQSVYQMITGNSQLNYTFSGNLNISTPVSLIGKVNLPFTESGIFKITK